MALTAYARSLGWYIRTIKEPVDKLGTYMGLHWPIEVKGPKGTLTKQQRDYIAECPGKVLVWRTERDVDVATKSIRTIAEFIHSANQ